MPEEKNGGGLIIVQPLPEHPCTDHEAHLKRLQLQRDEDRNELQNCLKRQTALEDRQSRLEARFGFVETSLGGVAGKIEFMRTAAVSLWRALQGAIIELRKQ